MAKRSKRIGFLVEFDQPEGANISDCRAYILDAVSTWRGSLRPPGGYGDDDPGDPLFNLDGDTVRVNYHRRSK